MSSTASTLMAPLIPLLQLLLIASHDGSWFIRLCMLGWKIQCMEEGQSSSQEFSI